MNTAIDRSMFVFGSCLALSALVTGGCVEPGGGGSSDTTSGADTAVADTSEADTTVGDDTGTQPADTNERVDGTGLDAGPDTSSGPCDDDPGDGCWTRLIGDVVGEQDQIDVEVGPDGSIFIAGTTSEALHGRSYNGGPSDGFIAKYDASGERQWTRLVGTASEEFETLRGLAVGPSGSAYVAGSTRGSLHGRSRGDGNDVQAFVVRYDASGKRKWTRLRGSGAEDRGLAVATDGSAVYLAGNAKGNFDGENGAGGEADGFLVKYDDSGKYQWTEFAVNTPAYDDIWDVLVGPGGDVYLAGRTTGNLRGMSHRGNGDTFLVAYTSDGSHDWSELLGTPAQELAWEIAADQSNGLYVVGATRGDLADGTNAGKFDAFTAKFTTAGDQKWVELLGSAEVDFGAEVAVGPSGDVMVAGTMSDALGGASFNGGENDTFVATYDGSGNRSEVRAVGTPKADWGYAVGVSSEGTVYAGGSTTGALAGGSSPPESLQAYLRRLD